MNERDDREVTVVQRSPLVDLAVYAATENWLHRHLPTAERWWMLWLADREALRIATNIADTLAGSRGRVLLQEHEAAERAASLGYIAELLTAERHVDLALKSHDVRASTVERLNSRRQRIAELISEAQALPVPAPSPKP